jgi:hypothetical protein
LYLFNIEPNNINITANTQGFILSARAAGNKINKNHQNDFCLYTKGLLSSLSFELLFISISHLK